MTASTAPATRFALTSPCKHCPFRSDITPYLRADRAAEIAQSIRDGAEFTCHKTTVPDEDDDTGGSMKPGPRAAFCAGALATLERGGETSNYTRVAERIGLYNPVRLNPAAPVYPSLTAWVQAHRPDTDLEHCGVVGPDCEDPAGFGGASGVYANPDEPMCDTKCSACGHMMCPSCTGDHADDDFPLCVDCIEEVTEL